MATSVDKLREALSGADFPTDRDELVRQAERSEADSETIRALRAIPPTDYADLTEVERSVSFEQPQPAGEEARRRHTRHDKAGVAGSEQEVPQHPMVEELGENRGS
ncbi:DUF2795 domain-containing protein [Saccharomonospora halophila]|uniref:DUF2795 domain-containing protein n=1 Tax=Saccharomonospora halophila TaxID=129922 RepID=UPI00035F0A4B|nr:DUF2795 domain-containing protein [Saccharomonospora halophila]